MKSSSCSGVSILGMMLGSMLSLPPTLASGILYGTVSFDATSNLYTYSYTLENLGGHGRINQFYISVNSIGLSDIGPTSFTSPPGWTLTVGWFPSFSSCADYLVCSSQWQWIPEGHTYVTGGLAEGLTLTGFTVQTPAAPMVTTQNTYFLYFPDTHFAQAGKAPVPDLLIPPPPPPTIPEPSASVLVSGGLVVLAIRRLRARKARELA